MILTEHQNFIDRAVDILKQDDRFAGIALGGSYITGNMDEFSDLDFVIVVYPMHIKQVMNERIRIAEKLGDLLSAFTGEHVGEPRLLICLYDFPLIHVDLKFVSLDDVGKRVEDPIILYQRENILFDAYSKEAAFFPLLDMQWIEDRFWIWVHYATGKIGRQEIFETIEFISFLRQTVIAPLILVKNGKLPRGVRKIEVDAPDDLQALLETVADHDVKSNINALRALIDLYLNLREPYLNRNLIVRQRAEERALEYFDDISKRFLVSE
jgi:predicted nucleotidyltransferase